MSENDSGVVNRLLQNLEQNANDKRKAVCWAFFEVEANGPDFYAHCIVCKDNGTNRGVYKHSDHSGTNNLHRHIRSEHLGLLNEVEQAVYGTVAGEGSSCPDRPKRCRYSQDENRSVVKYPRTNVKQLQFSRKLVAFVVGCHLPLSICDAPEFRDLIAFFDPRITVPSRRTLTDVAIPKMVEEMRASSVNPILEACQSGCLLYDVWMSRRTVDTMGLVWYTVTKTFDIKQISFGLVECQSTCGVSLAKDICHRIAEFGVQRKTVGLVRDGAANLRVAATEMKTQLRTPLSPQLYIAHCQFYNNCRYITTPVDEEFGGFFDHCQGWNSSLGPSEACCNDVLVDLITSQERFMRRYMAGKEDELALESILSILSILSFVIGITLDTISFDHHHHVAGRVEFQEADGSFCEPLKNLSGVASARQQIMSLTFTPSTSSPDRETLGTVVYCFLV